MKSKTLSKNFSLSNSSFFYPALIFLVWLISYVVVRVLLVQKLGWDEVSYLSVARGIAQDFDFGSRAYTVMGLIKCGYPTNLINFPVFSAFLAIFFKLFGVSLHAAYFSTWLSTLGVCLLIYFIFLMLSESSKKFAFVASMSYLFCPGILKNCDTAMMEQFGCFLICLSVFLILQDYIKGEFNYLTVLKFSLSFLILWLFKSIYIGFLFGAFVFICFVYNSNISGKKIKTKISLPLFLLSTYGIFAILFYIVKKFIFLPVAPMMNFSPQQEVSQTYADFLGGFFNNFFENVTSNLSYFIQNIVGAYFIYPSSYMPYTGDLLQLTGYYIFLGAYFLLFIIMILFSFTLWKKLSPLVKAFLVFTFSSIIFFNLIFDVLFRSYHGNIWRYNVYYLPIYLCSLWIFIKIGFERISPYFSKYPIASKVLVSLFLVFIYLPMFLSTFVQYLYYEEWFHNTAEQNAKLVRNFIKDAKPKFIYFNHGTHTTFVDYPIKQIFKDATNEQLFQVNKILPEPIEFLFLRPGDWLFRNNQEQIFKGQPILNDEYKIYGYSKEAQVVVYRHGT